MSAEKIKIDKLVVVEGKYDYIKLSSIIEGTIICTDGFSIYKDKEKQALIRTIGEKNGIIIATDSDKAGFQLRNFIRSIAAAAEIENIYIPQVEGKEKRKRTPSKEGFLGVEGIDSQTLREIFTGLSSPKPVGRRVTKLDFYNDGLSGGENSAQKRREFLKAVNLPSHLSAAALLNTINALYGYDEYKSIVNKL